MNSLIKISNLNKTFVGTKKIKVLKKLTYDFKKGKIYSLMGPSGSGKSTLLNLLSLVDRPNTGSIFFENKLIDFNNNNKNDVLRANKIGIIYQQDNLLPDFTALENIYLASLAAGINKEESILKAEKLLKKAVQLMPDDPIVNDHYGDILWKLDRKIQARYFWSMVLEMEDVEEDLIDQIKNKLITGLKNS